MSVEGLCGQVVSSLDLNEAFINAWATISIRNRVLKEGILTTCNENPTFRFNETSAAGLTGLSACLLSPFPGRAFARDVPIQEWIGSGVKD